MIWASLIKQNARNNIYIYVVFTPQTCVDIGIWQMLLTFLSHLFKHSCIWVIRNKYLYDFFSTHQLNVCISFSINFWDFRSAIRIIIYRYAYTISMPCNKLDTTPKIRMECMCDTTYAALFGLDSSSMEYVTKELTHLPLVPHICVGKQMFWDS